MLTPEQRRIGRRNFFKAVLALPVAVAFGYSVWQVQYGKAGFCEGGRSSSTRPSGKSAETSCTQGKRAEPSGPPAAPVAPHAPAAVTTPATKPAAVATKPTTQGK